MSIRDRIGIFWGATSIVSAGYLLNSTTVKVIGFILMFAAFIPIPNPRSSGFSPNPHGPDLPPADSNALQEEPGLGTHLLQCNPEDDESAA